MMKEGEEEDETTPNLSTPPADLRCHRLDGKGWHCKGWRLQDKVYCQKHYFEYRSKSEKKKKMKESNGVKKNGQEKKFKRNDDVGKLNLKKKFDLDVGETKGLKKNGVESEDRSEVEIVLALKCDKKMEKIDLDGSISKKVKKNGVDCKDGKEGRKIEMIPLKGCDNKKEKFDLAVEAANGVKDETMVKMKSAPEKEQAECRRSQRSNAGVSKRYCKEEKQVEMITVRESDKKRGKSDLYDCGGVTLVNDSSKGQKQGRGRPKKVGGSKRNYREEEEVDMITVRESDKKREKSDLDGSGGDTLVDDSSKGEKRGRGRPRKVRGISNGVKENGVESEEGGKIEMILSSGFDNEKGNFGLAVEGDNRVQDETMVMMESVSEMEKPELRQSKSSNVGGSKSCREEEEVEMITVKESDKKRGKSDLDGGDVDSLVNDSCNAQNGERPTKVEGGPLKEFEQTKSTSRSSSLMRHWLLVKRDRELEMKSAANCGTMWNVGRNENLTTENESTEEEKNEDCKKGYDLADGGPTVVKDSLNAVKSKAELLEESEDKKYEFAGGSENISRISKYNLPKCNDETLSADGSRTLK